jgi:hypothetical protein
VFKKNGKFISCVDFRKLHIAMKKDPYMLPFTNEVITIVVGHEVYTFLYGILYTIRFSITSKDHYKTSFVTY